MADDSIISYGDLIGDDGTFLELSKQIKQIESELLDMAKTTKQAFQSLKPSDLGGLDKLEKKVKEIEVAEKNLVKTKKLANKARKKTIDLTNEELIQREKEKIQNRERLQIAKQTAILRSKDAGQIEKLRAKLSITTLAWKKLSKEELNNTKKGKDLINTKRKLTDQLKKLEKQTGDTRRNVGNYTSSLGKLGKAAAAVFIGRSIVDGLRRISGAFSKLVEDNKNANSGMRALSDSVGKVTETISAAALKVINFFAPALTAIADTISSVINVLTGTENKLEGFKATSKELTGVISELDKELVKELATSSKLFISLNNTTKGTKERKEAIDSINSLYGKYLENLLTEKSSIEDITSAEKLLTKAITTNFLAKIQSATLTDIVTNKVEAQKAAFEKLKFSLKGTIDITQLGAFSEVLTDLGDNTTDLANVFETQFGSIGKSAKQAAAEFNKRIKDNNLNTIEELRAFSDKLDKEAAATLDRLGKTNPEIKKLFDKLIEAKNNINKYSDSEKKAFEQTIKGIRDAALASKRYDEAINSTNKSIQNINKSLITYDHTVTTNTSNLDKNAKAQKDNTAVRLKAITTLQDKIIKAEAGAVSDKEDRLLALEDAKFRALQTKRKQDFEAFKQLITDQENNIIAIHGEKSQELKDFIAQADRELLEVEALNQKLSEQQLAESEQRKLDIRAKFDKLRIDRATKAVTKAQTLIKKQTKEDNKVITDSIKENQKIIQEDEQRALDAQKEANEKRKKNNKELLNNISQTAKKVSAVINDIFQKQVDLSAKSVEEQEANLARSQDRTAKGLQTNLAFEEQELAKRQSENLKRQKEAKQAAKFLTLLNLVSSYAASGDKNALARGLVDFSILTALEASFGGLYEGTEDTGTVANPLDAKGGRLYTLHDNERVVPKFLNDQLSGMTNKDMVYNALLGSQIGDYYNPQGPITQDYYKAQRDAFKRDIKATQAGNSEVVNAIKNLENKIVKQPNYTAQIVRVQEDTHAFILREVKQGMTKVYKKMLRAKK